MIHLLWYIPLCGLLILLSLLRIYQVHGSVKIKDVAVTVLISVIPGINVLAFIIILLCIIVELDIWEAEL